MTSYEEELAAVIRSARRWNVLDLLLLVARHGLYALIVCAAIGLALGLETDEYPTLMITSFPAAFAFFTLSAVLRASNQNAEFVLRHGFFWRVGRNRVLRPPAGAPVGHCSRAETAE